MSSSRPLVVTTGCPSGIGPEIAVKAVAKARAQGISCVIVGDHGVLVRAAHAFGFEPARIITVASLDQSLPDDAVPVVAPLPPLDLEDVPLNRATAWSGRAQLAWIDHAVDLTRSGQAAAMVTGPVSKEAIAKCGASGAEAFTGHTEHIARRLDAGPPVMTFVADELTVALVTTHIPLAEVPRALTVDGVQHAIVQCVLLLQSLGKRPPAVFVAALNPHAGESGMFGLEEREVIEPAVLRAREQLKQAGVESMVDGPKGAETAFRLAFSGGGFGVVAMYHDQATIPMKLVCFGKAVNVTAGLPIVRTSVDHGTAYDIAGTGRADPASMLAAILLAARLA